MNRHAMLALAFAGLYTFPATAGSGLAAEKRFEARLDRLLDPTARLDFRGFTSEPKPRVGPRWLEQPDIVPIRAEVLAPTLPTSYGKPPAPRPLPERPPLSYYHVAAEVPQAPRLPAGSLAKEPGLDVRTPPPLPTFGTYVADRVSVADPSLEISVAQTRTPQQPARTAEVPFTPWNLPDPFENAEVVRLRQAWPESAEPPAFQSPTRR